MTSATLAWAAFKKMHLERLLLAGQRPVPVGKIAYYADPEFRGIFDGT